ncbi:MAG: hypothetical protein RIC81_01325 [Microcella pacifica]|uniref:hypothetical protein n=1 Tax=Microcella pacifica TaxID=2591847 RepID=UPI003315D4CC
MTKHTRGDHADEPTQGDNPGAQGDIGAGQAEADETDPQLQEEDEAEGNEDDNDEFAPDLEDFVDRDPGEDATSVNGGNADR